MQRNLWIGIAVVALAVAVFFGVRTYQLSKPRADPQRATIERQLEDARKAEQEAARRASQEAEARRLAEDKAKRDAEAEARRLAQAESERQLQEQARQRAEAEARKAAAELERLRNERADITAEAQRLAEMRAKEAADAQAKLAAAQRALEESERKKNAEIERQAALIASYNRSPAEGETTRAEPAPAQRPAQTRIIFPSYYKRAPHYNLPLLRQREAREEQ